MFIDKIDISTDLWRIVPGNYERRGEEYSVDFSEMKVVERIGSPSTEAEVYRIKVSGKEFACKILPILNSGSSEKYDNELYIASELSGSPYFPKLYQYGFCKRTEYNESSMFYEESYKYFYLQKMCKDMSKAQKLRMRERYDANSEKDERIDISSHFLIFELCFSDLRHISSRFRLNEKAWKEIILDVLEGIKYMNEEKGILHGDLHCGNVLIKIDKNKKAIPLISDFGKSKECEFLTLEERTMDAQKFIYDLTLNLDVPETMKWKLNRLLIYISTFPRPEPIMTRIINFAKKYI